MLDKLMRRLPSSWISEQLRLPTKSPIGRVVSSHFQRESTYLEKGAVKLLNIQANDRVLEVGFGGGVGLRTAYWRVANGDGMIYGVERSHFMLERGRKYCALEIAEGKVHLNLAMVTHLPFPDGFFDNVFHCNCYYYWENLVLAAAELKRVMKPGATMIATLSTDDLRRMDADGFMRNSNPDPLDYMHSLETVGFESVAIKYLTIGGGGKTGGAKNDDENEDDVERERTYQAIFSTKPLKDEEISTDDLEVEEERFRRALSEVHAAEIAQRSHRASGFDPIEKRTTKDNDEEGETKNSALDKR